MTDQIEKFYALREVVENLTHIHDMTFTDDQMRLLCTYIDFLGRGCSKPLMSHPQMTEQYLDLVFARPSNAVADILDIINESPCVQPRHIEQAIDFIARKRRDRTWVFDQLVTDVFHHPLCSESMRVKYHLLRGE